MGDYQSFEAAAERQLERKRQFYEAYRTVLEDQPEDMDIDPRSTVWNAIAYWNCGRPEKANRLLRGVKLQRCYFMPMQMLEIIKEFGESIDSDVREKMTDYVMGVLPDAARETIHISMYNDNFSNMATYVLIVAGELFHQETYLALGKERLTEVCELFSRSGTIMEYGSPTYTPIDTVCFAQLANHAEDPWVRQTALQCEERMWLEIASHYHPGTAMLAGPHSRAYGADSIGHPGIISGLLWKVLGDAVFINPILDCFPPHPNQVVHGSLELLMYPNLAWVINAQYHCPEALVGLALRKTYPYHVSSRTECLPSNLLAGSRQETELEYCHCPGGRGLITTYMTEEYALGTADNHFHSGAISSSFRDEGRKYGSQEDNISVVMYHPGPLECEHVTSARLSLLIPCYFFEGYELFAGKTRVEDFSYTSASAETVYVRANDVYFAFVPLTTTDLGRDRALCIEKKNQHLMLSYYNYHGDPRRFTARELVLAQAGFVCICSTRREHPTMEDFMRYVDQGRLLEDRMEEQERAFCRRLRYRHGETEFRLILNPEGGCMVVDTVNRRPRDLAVFEADGLAGYRIPFLEDADGNNGADE